MSTAYEQLTGLDLHFLPLGENKGSPRSSPRRQRSSALHLDGFESCGIKIRDTPDGVSHILVPLTGLEPVRGCPQGILSPWCLPFHHSGIYSSIILWGSNWHFKSLVSTIPPVAVPDKIFGLTLFLDFVDRCHSLRQSTRYTVPFPANRKLHLYLGFSSPHKVIRLCGVPFFLLPPAALPSLPTAAYILLYSPMGGLYASHRKDTLQWYHIFWKPSRESVVILPRKSPLRRRIPAVPAGRFRLLQDSSGRDLHRGR